MIHVIEFSNELKGKHNVFALSGFNVATSHVAVTKIFVDKFLV